MKERNIGSLLYLLHELLPEWDSEKFSNAIEENLKTLSERERFIVHQRFGLTGQPPKTLNEIAAELKPANITQPWYKGNKQNESGITRERVRQLEAKILRKLRHPTRLGSILQSIGLMKWRSREQVAKEENKTIVELMTSEPIGVLFLSTKAENSLRYANVETVEDLLKAVKSGDIYMFRNMGLKTVQVIIERLNAYYQVEGE